MLRYSRVGVFLDPDMNYLGIAEQFQQLQKGMFGGEIGGSGYSKYI